MIIETIINSIPMTSFLVLLMNLENKMISQKTIKKEMKNFDKSFKSFKTKLEENFGIDEAQKIIDQTRIEYEKLLPETPAFKGKVNVFNMVMKINVKNVAFYKAMKLNGKTVEETNRIFYDLAEEEFTGIPRPARFITRKVIFSRFWLWVTRRSAKNVYDHPDGWKVHYEKGDGKSSDWNFNREECGVIKYYKRHNVEELGHYCNYVDYLQSKIFGLGMENPKSLGRGDKVCIELFKQGRKTVEPNNLKGLIAH